MSHEYSSCGSRCNDNGKRRVGELFEASRTARPRGKYLCRIRGLPGLLTRADAVSLLHSIDLQGLESRRPGQLSGGEQQRLALARALAAKPSMLLLDEPFSSVDTNTKRMLYTLLQKFSPLVPGPTIYVTHSEQDAFSLGEAIVSLDRGQLISGGGT